MVRKKTSGFPGGFFFISGLPISLWTKAVNYRIIGIYEERTAGDRLDYVKMLAFAFIAALLIMLIKAFRNWTRQTSAILQALKIGEAAREMRKETPCSVCGMTRLILPQIAEDFRSFPIRNSRPERKPCFFPILRRSHRSSRSGSANGPPALLEQVRQELTHQRADGTPHAYSEVRLHQTELADYRKQDGECRVVFQSAVGYMLRIGDGEAEQKQTRYNVELLYVQDAGAAQEHQLDAAFSMTCPNCGAPIRSLGSKVCEFCGTAVQEVNHYAGLLTRSMNLINRKE